jgi:hypothetical protein
MFEFSKTKLSILEIWAVSFKLYKQTIAKVWYLAFLMLLVLHTSMMISAKMRLPMPAGQAAKQAASAAQAVNPLAHLTLSGVLINVIGILLSLFIMAVILHRIYNLATKPDFSLTASINFVLSKYLIIFSCMLLLYVAVSVGILLFIIPGIFLGILFLFSLLFILFNDAGWLSAIKKSCQLVWGNWWRTFAVFIVPAVIIAVIQNLIVFMFGVHYIWLNIFVVALVISLIKPYLDAVLLVQFNDLKLRQVTTTTPPQ